MSCKKITIFILLGNGLILILNYLFKGIINYYLPLNFIYLTSIVIIFFVFAIRQKRRINIFKILKNKHNLALILILAVALALRVWRLGEESLWIDEIWHTYAAYIAENENSFVKAAEIYDKSYIVTFLVHIMGNIFGFVNEFFLRIPFVLLGVLAVLISYLLGSEFSNKKTGLLFAWIMCLSPMMIMQSRNIRFYMIMAIFVLLLLFFYIKFLKNKEKKYLYGVLALSFGSLVILPFYFLIILPFLFFHYIFKNRKKTIKQIRHKKIFIFCCFLAFLLLAFLFLNKFSWVFQENFVHSRFYYFKNFIVYEFLFFIIILLGFFKNLKATWYFYLSLFLILAVLSFAPIQYPKYYLFLLPILYLLAAYSCLTAYEFIKRKHHLASLLFLLLIFALPVYNFSKFNVYNKNISLDEKISVLKNPNDAKFILNYFNFNFFKLIRSPLLVKADYKNSAKFINEYNGHNLAVIIAESPYSLKYYGQLYNYNFQIIHPHYNFNKIQSLIKNQNAPVYAMVGHRLKLNQQNKIDIETQNFIFNNMKQIKKFNGLEIYKLP